MNLYRSKEWKLFRTEVLHLGEWACAQCSRGSSQGVILHVHHKAYLPGRKPWEYRYEDCDVLCQSCHAQERGIISPKTDWEFVGYDDLGAPDGHCDYCGTQIHVFMIQHEKWATLEVGETCCDNLTTTSLATAIWPRGAACWIAKSDSPRDGRSTRMAHTFSMQTFLSE